MTSPIGIEYIDDLTRLFNRRYLSKQAPVILRDSLRQNIPLSIILLDLDHFKNINDSFGHAYGDIVLKEFAIFLKTLLRENDLIFRYGGDEFLCILPHTTYNQTAKISERFIKRCRNEEFNKIRVTISVGISAAPEDANDWKTLFEIADRNLYSAKRHGRDRIGVFQEQRKKLLIPTDELVGRDKELRKLKDFLGSISYRKGGAISICGEAGIGKTRLVQETIKASNSEDFYLVHSNLSAITQSIPYYPFREIIREAQNKYPVDVIASVQHAYIIELTKIVPELATQHQISTTDIEIVDKFRLFEGVRQYFFSIIQQTALIVFLDNAQWADTGSLEILHYLLKALRDQPVIFVIVYRIEEAGEGSLPQILQLLAREVTYDELKLNPLSHSEVTLLLSSILDSKSPPELTNFIVQNTGGNPFFIEELLKSMEINNALEWNSPDWQFDINRKVVIPYTIEGVVERRLTMVSEETRKLLEYASVIGREFDFSFLMQVTQLNQGLLFDMIDEIMKVRLFKERDGEKYYFPEEVIREIIYQKINSVKLKHLHELVGQCLLKLCEQNPAERIEELAFHFYHAQVYDRAATFCIEAADKAKNSYAHQNAVRFYDWALKSLGNLNNEQTNISKIQCHLRQADVLIMIGKTEEAEQDIVHALNLAQQEKFFKFEADSILKLSRIHNASGKHKHAITYIKKALGIYERLNDLSGIADCDRCLGISHFFLGNYEEAIRYFDQSLTFSKKTKDLKAEIKLLINLGVVYKELNEYERALEYYKKSLKITKANDDLHGQAVNYANLANIYLIQHDNKKSLQYTQKALETNKKVGDLHLTGICLTNIGILLFRMGDEDTALENFNEALKINEEIGDTHSIALNLSNIGSYYFEHGELNEALTLFERALHSFQMTDEKAGQAQSFQNIGRICYIHGDYDAATQNLLLSIEINEQIKHLRELAICFADLAMVYSELKDFPKAGELYQKAYTMSLEIGLETIQAHVLYGYTDYYLDKKDFKGASIRYDQLTTLQSGTESQDFAAQVKSLAGRLHAHRKEWKQADQLFNEAYTILHQIGRPFEEAQIKYYLGELSQQQGDPDRARQFYNEARTIFQRLGARKWMIHIEEILSTLT